MPFRRIEVIFVALTTNLSLSSSPIQWMLNILWLKALVPGKEHVLLVPRSQGLEINILEAWRPLLISGNADNS